MIGQLSPLLLLNCQIHDGISVVFILFVSKQFLIQKIFFVLLYFPSIRLFGDTLYAYVYECFCASMSVRLSMYAHACLCASVRMRVNVFVIQTKSK